MERRYLRLQNVVRSQSIIGQLLAGRRKAVSAGGIKGLIRTAVVLVFGVLMATPLPAADSSGAREFHRKIEPLLQKYCYDCHGDGSDKGKVSFDEFKSDQAVLEDRDLWLHALKNLRADLMPPARKPQPTAEEKKLIENWIKRSVFEIDPLNPDPGHVTLRRLNRIEYRNTVRDLIDVEYDTMTAFPADDTGYGFDNIGDVLTLPPMLLEKYLTAANEIVRQAVPSVSRMVREEMIPGRDFRSGTEIESGDRRNRQRRFGSLPLSYYTPAAVSNSYTAKFAGKYQLVINLVARDRFVDNVFDYNKCRLILRSDGKELLREEFSWQSDKPYHYQYDVDWQPGDHELTFELQPLTPDEKQTRTLSLQITGVNVRGPMDQEHWVKPENHDRFFKKEIPGDAKDRRLYAAEILGGFATKAFRRPVDPETLDRLVDLAEEIYSKPGKAFEAGVSQAMVAILASPRFLFREERLESSRDKKGYAYVDDYSLASRLSYFLWSSMPDDELFQLATAGQLRKNLSAQVDRMLKDKRSSAFVRNFAGQWLRSRDIEGIPIEARSVLSREEQPDPERTRNRKRFRELNDKSDDQLTEAEKEERRTILATFRRSGNRPPRAELDGDLRRAMRQETEKSLDYLIREDRSLLELIDCNYAFLNEKLARHYGITNVSGDEVHLVQLPENSPRGGILTQGTMLGVTSNPTRTSPVKRGLYILENILGTPPPPPPPDIPPLEEATKGVTNRVLSLRETLAAHRADALCSSCHNRMDPLGLALENFNAMGMWRDGEFGEKIDAAGQLVNGEKFEGVRELKQLLVKNHAQDFYRTVAEKLLTYALGRGLEYYDVETVDRLVAQLSATKGRPSALIAGVVDSAPFLKSRTNSDRKSSSAEKPVQQRADAQTKP